MSHSAPFISLSPTQHPDDLTPGTSMYVSFGELQTLSRQHAFLEVKWASTVAMAILHLHSIGYGGP